MIAQQLIDPKSIAVIGGSDNCRKPGGKIVQNLLKGGFSGDLYVVNPNPITIDGVSAVVRISDLPEVDLAILAIPARECISAVTTLTQEKNTKGFIIISAGFNEASEEGRQIEDEIVRLIEKVNASLIGPNCIGVLNRNYHGVFTTPIPILDNHGCDLISSSGATAVFVMEAGIPVGLRFNSVYSVGNAAQIGVEEILEYMDETFHSETSSRIKLLYMEDVRNPQKLLKHAASLIRKGCKIAGIKAGVTKKGSKAAASHTGAIAKSEVAIRALFIKAGIVFCSSREELISVASVFSYKELTGKKIAVITHAGGSAVMLTDVLCEGGLEVPEIEGRWADELREYLFAGSSVSNPIDFLATGTAEQLGIIIDYCEHKFDNIDAMVVVFGSPGLFDVENVYQVLRVKLEVCKKPIYPVLPSLINAQKEIGYFLSKGYVNFPDEVLLGKALANVYHTPMPSSMEESSNQQRNDQLDHLLTKNEDGYLPVNEARQLLEIAGIQTVNEVITHTSEEAALAAKKLGFPVAMKAIGPLHKSDSGGVLLNVANKKSASSAFKKLISLPKAEGVLIQPMVQGIELFVGAKYEEGFGHIILCGLGGIFVEVLGDVRAGIAPLTSKEVHRMVSSLKGYPLLQGIRGQQGVEIASFVDVIKKISDLVHCHPEIKEMDINPLIGRGRVITAVDSRMLIGREKAINKEPNYLELQQN